MKKRLFKKNYAALLLSLTIMALSLNFFLSEAVSKEWDYAKMIPKAKTAASMPKYITFFGGGSATSTYTLAGKAMEAATKELFPAIKTRVLLGAGSKNQQRLEGWTDNVMTNTPWAISDMHTFTDHSNGKGKFVKLGKFKDLRLLIEVVPVTAQMVVVLKKSPITDICQLKDKKVSCGSAAGSSWEMQSAVWKAGCGFDVDDIKAAGGMLYLDGWSEQADMLASGDIDAFAMNLIQPYAGITKVNVTKGIRMLPISEVAVAGAIKNYHSLAKTTVPLGTYEGQTKPYKTFGIILALFTHKNVPDDVAYNLLAMWLEGNARRARELHPKAYTRPHAEFGLKAFESGKKIDLYHPGALKFWKEVAGRK
ncbi:TAXI family TRAP transporter solute-binding subunit [Thermodesulfobacteriota bacterium]